MTANEHFKGINDDSQDSGTKPVGFLLVLPSNFVQQFV